MNCKSLLVVFFCGTALFLSAQELNLKGKWFPSQGVVLETEGNSLKVTIPKSEQKISFAGMETHYWNAPLNATGLQKVEVKFKTSEKIKLAVTLGSKGGNFTNVWPPEEFAPGTHTAVFARAGFKPQKEVDLAAITKLSLGVGLWTYDTTQKPLNLVIESVRIVK